MANYKKVNELYSDIDFKTDFNLDLTYFKEWISLLNLLEKINYCGQNYEIRDKCIVVSYKFKLNVLNFSRLFPLKLNVEIIGLPISISSQGYFGNPLKVKDIVEKRKGLKIILNSDKWIEGGGNTLSSFVFYNRFKNFEDYLNSLRSPYRRRLIKALNNRKGLSVEKIDKKTFNKEHYKLYLSIMNRTKDPLEILPIEFFQQYETEIYEFKDKNTDKILGFIQVKEVDEKLLFLFGGFNKEENKGYDLYYNMLLKIVELGIQKNVSLIEFGQTAEESKLKIGCIEKKKYLYIHHSNSTINKIIKALVPFLSYKSYDIKHNVFKEDINLKVEKL